MNSTVLLVGRLGVIALAIVLLFPAHVVAQERAAWMADARWGVMTHYLADWIARADTPAQPMTVERWNDLIDHFDVAGLAGQLQSMGAGYHILTVGQNSGFYLAPNAAYDRFVGNRPSRCSRRDLVAELGAALHARGIRLIVYLPAGAPAGDRAAVEALEWRNGAHRNQAFQLKWEQIVREWSLRWGKLVDGWWFDGCYWPNTMYRAAEAPSFASFAASARAGNAGAVVAFNPGVVDRTLSITPEEDYIAGEVDHPDKFMIRRVERGSVDGARLHMLTYLGETWGRGAPRFTSNEIAAATRKVTRSRGAVTWDVPIGRDGLIAQPFVDRLRAAGKLVRNPD